jgi:formylglycine-generating enzyme required for sulfatase activity/serine/threonine protein kinase
MVGNFHPAGQNAGLGSCLLPGQADGLPETLLDAVLAEQRRDWIAGKRIPADERLCQHPELADKPACAAELIYHEFSLRQELGESPDWHDLLRQYPEHALFLERLRQADQLVEATLVASEQWPADTFADYELLEEVGRGGMGVVYKARHQRLDRIVALKVLRSRGTGEERNRFEREAQAVARLQHPNIVQVYEVGETAGEAFVSLEFVEGQSLARRLHGTPLPARQAAELIEILARAMHYAHKKGIIHRDLKPSNIMIRLGDGTFEPVIVDFGLARCIESGGSRLTASGLFIGTWQYMTPEQLCGEPDALGAGCDIYALGVIMYELLTGRLPFDAPGQVVRGNPASPSSYRADVDPRLETICLKAMAASSAARYVSMGDLASAVADYLRSKPQIAGPGNLVPNSGDRAAISQASTAPDALPAEMAAVPQGPELVAGPLATNTPAQRVRKATPVAIDGSRLPATPRAWYHQLVVTGITCALIAIAFGSLAGGVLSRNSPTPAAFRNADIKPFRPPPKPRDVVHLDPQPLDCTGINGVSADGVRTAQKAWAKYLGRDVEEHVEIASGVTMTFVLVPPGKFLMGSTPDETGKNGRYHNETLHVVTLTEPFDLGITEVTQAQYAALTGKSPSYHEGSSRPVEQVTWDDADAFGRSLTKKLADGYVYRLVTEAEWEYSCRGGRPSSETFGVGDGRSLTSREANINGTLGQTSNAGSYAASALGLYDMHGNVWEWCADWMKPYSEDAVTNNPRVVGGPFRVARGGCYNEPAVECRSALRQGSPAERRDCWVGFRLARSIPSAGLARVRPTN